ncbi:MAG: methylmalonyl Co-A mutase-associated GTPase MeaB [Saprospiraceae bacterium]|nr:methylmalonyl Co-A mutase-associated GTPase MeaB [Saprospiraceae bacterium]
MSYRNLPIDQVLSLLQQGDKQLLARLITCAESNKKSDQIYISEILSKFKYSANMTRRIGITGSPGVGKSSLIEKIGFELIKQGRKLAVLTIDPSSSLTRGSILGDKTRMVELSKEDLVFIRPSPSKNHLGGISEGTRSNIQLCEIAGFQDILIETVGIGQSEHEVSSVSDMTIWIGIGGAGDELQGIKRGIMEWADLMLINKSDGSNIAKSTKTKNELQSVIGFMPFRKNNKKAEILLTSALENQGIEEIIKKIDFFFQDILNNNKLISTRLDQEIQFFNQKWQKEILQELLLQKEIHIKHSELINLIESKKIDANSASIQLQEFIFAHFKDRKSK